MDGFLFFVSFSGAVKDGFFCWCLRPVILRKACEPTKDIFGGFRRLVLLRGESV